MQSILSDLTHALWKYPDTTDGTTSAGSEVFAYFNHLTDESVVCFCAPLDGLVANIFEIEKEIYSCFCSGRRFHITVLCLWLQLWGVSFQL